jgi:hypothetical protein
MLALFAGLAFARMSEVIGSDVARNEMRVRAGAMGRACARSQRNLQAAFAQQARGVAAADAEDAQQARRRRGGSIRNGDRGRAAQNTRGECA